MFDTNGRSNSPTGFYIETSSQVEVPTKVFTTRHCVNTWNVTTSSTDSGSELLFTVDFSIIRGLHHAEVQLNSNVLSDRAVDILKNCRIRPVELNNLQDDYEYLFINKLNEFRHTKYFGELRTCKF